MTTEENFTQEALELHKHFRDQVDGLLEVVPELDEVSAVHLVIGLWCLGSPTVDVDEAITHVAKRFAGDEFYYYRGFPVMKNNRVVGRIILRDVLRALEVMSREESKAGSSF